jgi:hypothetical protein
MHLTRYLLTLLVALAVIGAGGPRSALGASSRTPGYALCPGDSFYVGDAGDNSVKRFCAQDGS